MLGRQLIIVEAARNGGASTSDPHKATGLKSGVGTLDRGAEGRGNTPGFPAILASGQGGLHPAITVASPLKDQAQLATDVQQGAATGGMALPWFLSKRTR